MTISQLLEVAVSMGLAALQAANSALRLPDPALSKKITAIVKAIDELAR